VRFATAEDVMEEKHLDASAREEMQCCERFVKEMELPMKIVDAEHVFGGERIIIYFISSGRVDFRELVKSLAREYQTRIELRQIGARDEARIISDYESCGRPCCCRQFLKILEPVNMRMAKLQKATLDPSKISGHCGRLKCCLRYEDATYRDLRKKLPKKNATVRTSQGVGKVVDMQILTQLVVVQDETGEKKAFSVDEIEIISDKSQDKEAAVPDSTDLPEDENDLTEDAESIEITDHAEEGDPKAQQANKNRIRTNDRKENREDQSRGADKD
jgi:cell fate regulator YaaT (PSP1 superfamily)